MKIVESSFFFFYFSSKIYVIISEAFFFLVILLSVCAIWTHSTLGLQWDWLDSRCIILEGALCSSFFRGSCTQYRLGSDGGRSSAPPRRRHAARFVIAAVEGTPSGLTVTTACPRILLLHLSVGSSALFRAFLNKHFDNLPLNHTELLSNQSWHSSSKVPLSMNFKVRLLATVLQPMTALGTGFFPDSTLSLGNDFS